MTADPVWCSPSGGTYGGGTPGLFDFTWATEFFDAGTSFTLLYKVTVPDNILPGTYTFAGTVGYKIDGNPTQYVAITGDSEVVVPKPDKVWVDDDWAGDSPGDIVDGHVFGYNAFDTIQKGIDNVGSSTVHVLAGTYHEQVLINKSVELLGEGNPFIDAHDLNVLGPQIGPYQGAYAVWITGNARPVTIEGFTITGSIDPSFIGGTGIVVQGLTTETGTININNNFLRGSGYMGLIIAASNVNVEANDIVENYWDGMLVAPGGFSDIAISNNTINNNGGGVGDPWTPALTDTGIECYGDISVSGNTISGNDDAGIWLGMSGSAEINGCNKILANGSDAGVPPDIKYGGILLTDTASATINGNNIAGNLPYGVDNEGTGTCDAADNWWGDEYGPTYVDNPFATTGDAITDNVSYIPWLDAECPGGKAIAPVADFSGTPRTGKPGLVVQFTDLSTGSLGCAIAAWAWDFNNDGIIDSTVQNPSNTYAAVGTYTVSLTVTDELDLSDTETKTGYIVVKSPRGRAAAPAAPAQFTASNLYITPEQVVPNQEVQISINICNTGGERASHTAVLYINGVVEDSRTVGVSGGSCQTVVFTVSKAAPRTYEVSVEGEEGQFFVLSQEIPTPAGIGG
ncbi:MAG: PKD domain-containing protein, partial [Chloroflexota bacterium]|nr:PKD domain-containing protein [Chloroflexota bacterium]